MADFPNHSFTTEEVPSITSDRTVASGRQRMADTDRLSDERLLLAIERLGGLEEIHHSTYAEFFDDAEALATAARELLSRRTSTGEAVAWQWSDHHGMWYTVDTNTDRMSFEQQKELAQQVAASNGGTVRPLYTVDDAMVERAAQRSYEYEGDRREIDNAGWDLEPDSVKEEWRQSCRVVLTAALRSTKP